MFLSGEKAVQPYSLIYRRAEIDSSDNECRMLCPWRYIGRLRFLDAVDLCPEARCLESITLCKQAISARRNRINRSSLCWPQKLWDREKVATILSRCVASKRGKLRN